MTDHYEQKLISILNRCKAEYRADKSWRNYDRLHIAEALLRSYRRRVIPEKYCVEKAQR